MPSKETDVETGQIGPDGWITVPVYYTDEFLETDIYDFSFSSVHGGFLPYLFVGYLRNKNGDLSKWYFANARRHDDMEMAIRNEVDGENDFIWGQIMFNRKRDEGVLEFGYLYLHQEISDNIEIREKELRKLIDVISPKYISDGFIMSHGIEWKYHWIKSEQRLEKVR